MNHFTRWRVKRRNKRLVNELFELILEFREDFGRDKFDDGEDITFGQFFNWLRITDNNNI